MRKRYIILSFYPPPGSLLWLFQTPSTQHGAESTSQHFFTDNVQLFMFPVAAAAKFSIVIHPFQSPLCAPGNLCHIVQGRAGPMSLIKALPSASWTSTNILAYIL